MNNIFSLPYHPSLTIPSSHPHRNILNSVAKDSNLVRLPFFSPFPSEQQQHAFPYYNGRILACSGEGILSSPPLTRRNGNQDRQAHTRTENKAAVQGRLFA